MATKQQNESSLYGKGWCGRNSSLPTDTQWAKIPYTRFNEDKRTKGHNRAFEALMMKL